ncbi:MAG: FGGY-family carbohydrate kinase [Spirochaetota bacterium]
MSEQIYLVGLDIGTTGVKALIADVRGNVIGMSYREYPCVYPYPGWVEQDVEYMWVKICEALREVIQKTGINPRLIRSLGISSQRGTFIPVDKNIKPLINSIVWSDGRADEEIKWIIKNIGEERYHEITGVPISSMWSYAKIKWFIDKRRDLFDRTYKILNGQEYFLFKLGADDLSTDPASLTLNGMLEIDKLDWSNELCKMINLPIEKLPPVGTPARMVGKVSKEAAQLSGLPEGMPISIGAGDQQCAAVGAGVIREGMAEITIGTAMVMVAHIDSRKEDKKRQVLIGGSGIPGKWDMEGLTFTAGAALRWWRDVYAQVEKQAAEMLGLDIYDLITLEASRSPAGSKGIIFFPCFQGQTTPYYYSHARGGSLGLSFIHDRKDVARSILEGVSFETKMVVSAMEEVLGKNFDVIRLSGGGSKSPLWNQIQADIYGRTVERLRVSECTPLGAAILGGVGCGIFNSVEEGVKEMVHPLDKIEPETKNSSFYYEEYEIFKKSFEVLVDNKVFEYIAKFQRKYWG